MFETADIAVLLERWLTFQIGPASFDPARSLLLIAALAAAAVSVFRLWHIGRQEDRKRRLDGLRGAAQRRGMAAQFMPWYRRLGIVIASVKMVGAAEQQKLLAELSAAGLRGHGDLATLLAGKLAGAVLFAGSFWLFLRWTGYFANVPLLQLALMAGFVFLGWRLPEVVLSRLAARRRIRLEIGFPDALDLLVICTEAGLSLDQSIEEVSKHLKRSDPEVAQEFAITAAEMQVLPDRSLALQNLARRAGLPALRSLVAALTQSIRFGTSLADTLRIIAIEMRAERTARFEENAARLPVLLTIPLMAFILPSLIIIIGTPLMLRIFDMIGTMLGGT